jgi:hypothetical protein
VLISKFEQGFSDGLFGFKKGNYSDQSGLQAVLQLLLIQFGTNRKEIIKFLTNQKHGIVPYISSCLSFTELKVTGRHDWERADSPAEIIDHIWNRLSRKAVAVAIDGLSLFDRP